jgi:hypothetical protein
LRKMLRHTRVVIADIDSIDLSRKTGAHRTAGSGTGLRSDL